MHDEQELIRTQLQTIERSGALGKSRSYSRLLAFLVECGTARRVPKELEIAIEVFGKRGDFDPSQDSMVRVYMHNLRQKLEHYYATDGSAEPRRLVVMRGEYRVLLSGLAEAGPKVASVTPNEPPPAAAAERPSERGPIATPPSAPLSPSPTSAASAALATRGRLALAAVLLLALGAAAGLGLDAARDSASSARRGPAASPVWSSLLADATPVVVVVGDYYIFAELDKQGAIERLVRNFDVNSSKDLDELMMYDAELLDRYLDLDLTYLPRGTATALLDVLRVLYAGNKPVRVMSMSELSVPDIKSNHIVYVGYISGLGMLEDFVFASSELAVGGTYDELRDVHSGELYSGEAGIPGPQGNYRDYGLISAFPGPSGNQFLIVAGMRDAGMMHAAHVLADPLAVRRIEDARPDPHGVQPPAFEMLYEVTGSGHTNLDAMLVHSAKLDYQRIWGGNFLHAEVVE